MPVYGTSTQLPHRLLSALLYAHFSVAFTVLLWKPQGTSKELNLYLITKVFL